MGVPAGERTGEETEKKKEEKKKKDMKMVTGKYLRIKSRRLFVKRREIFFFFF